MKLVSQNLANIWFPGAQSRSEAALQLFCFPFAGGGASAYARWRPLLQPTIEKWAIEYPAHESRLRELPVSMAIELAAQIAGQIAHVVDRPFAFFGHSMGALLAFETAQILADEYGLEPSTLFVSGYSAPHLPPHRPPVRDLPEAAFRNELRGYGGTPEEILADERFMEFLSPLLRRDLGLCETYAHVSGKGLRCPIVAFGGFDDLTVPWDRLLAWSELTAGGFCAHLMPGGHFYINSHGPEVTGLVHRHLFSDRESRRTPPQRDEVHLWTADIDQPASIAEALRTSLNADERVRADAFIRADDRARSIVGRGVLRDLLKGYADVPARALPITTSSTGKPGCEAAKPIEFNVSHSGGKVLIGFASEQSLGVDIERVRAAIYTEQMAGLIATPGELARLAAIEPALRGAAFFDLWVRKEACLKRTGQGFGGFPKMLEAGLSRALSPPGASLAGDDTRLLSFTVSPGYAAALAAERPVRLVTVQAWSAETPHHNGN